MAIAFLFKRQKYFWLQKHTKTTFCLFKGKTISFLFKPLNYSNDDIISFEPMVKYKPKENAVFPNAFFDSFFSKK